MNKTLHRLSTVNCSIIFVLSWHKFLSRKKYLRQKTSNQPNFYYRTSAYTVSQKKRHPFYFCDIFVRFHPILLIFGRNIPQEIWKKHMYTVHIISCFICPYCTLEKLETQQNTHC